MTLIRRRTFPVEPIPIRGGGELEQIVKLPGDPSGGWVQGQGAVLFVSDLRESVEEWLYRFYHNSQSFLVSKEMRRSASRFEDFRTAVRSHAFIGIKADWFDFDVTIRDERFADIAMNVIVRVIEEFNQVPYSL